LAASKSSARSPGTHQVRPPLTQDIGGLCPKARQVGRRLSPHEGVVHGTAEVDIDNGVTGLLAHRVVDPKVLRAFMIVFSSGRAHPDGLEPRYAGYTDVLSTKTKCDSSD
jgi:hypothetical protein